MDLNINNVDIDIIYEGSEGTISSFVNEKNYDIYLIIYDRDKNKFPNSRKIIFKQKIEAQILYALVNKLNSFKDKSFDFILDKVWYRLHLEKVTFEKMCAEKIDFKNLHLHKDDYEEEIKDATLDGTD